LSWGKGYPELLADCDFALNEEFNTAMTPIKNETYDFVGNILAEMTRIFPDEYYHNGGDEVQYSCWDRDEEIQAYREETGMTNEELFRMYWFRLLDIMAGIGKKAISWEEVFLEGLNPPSSNIIHIWTRKGYLLDAVRGGYTALLSAGWYLDRQAPRNRPGYAFQDTWKDFYNNEPYSPEMTDEEKSRILGGETCMWSERVDEYNVEGMIYPRASAVAERLWSPQDVVLAELAAPRLAEFRCRMVNRGIKAGPIDPGPPCFMYLNN